MKNVSLHEILMEIKKQSGKNFIYNNNLIDKFKNETIDLKNAKIEDVLKEILAAKNLNYKVVDEVIIIDPKAEKKNPVFQTPTTITGVVTDSLNNPVPYASVYLSKTTIGTITDSQGAYNISVPQNGVYEMISSCIGYKSNMQIINAEGKSLTINIVINVNIYALNEVTVKAKDRDRRKNYRQFVKSFIGESYNSQFCKIINPEDLLLYTESENSILRGYSIKPLRIENRALGYTIIYDLTDFSYDYDNYMLKFSGYSYFKPLKGTSRRNDLWKINRLAAYYGSKMHFIRALFSDSLSRESYKLFECKYDPVKKEYSATMPVRVKSIRLLDNKDYITLLHKDPLLINYTDNHPELIPEGSRPESSIKYSPNVIVSYSESSAKPISEPEEVKPKEYKSIISFSDTLTIYQNGYYYKPYSITWSGDMANDRIAGALPYDFLLDEKDMKLQFNEISEMDQPVQGTLEMDQVLYAEKVYLHTDHQYYNPGNDIWFKSYVINASTNRPSQVTNNLHVELISPAAEIIQDRILRIESGTGNGDFHLPDSLPSGRYVIRAYTNYMRNFDDHFFFSKELVIINPEDDGNELVDSVKYLENKIAINFFPEGGSLVENVPSIVAFKAVNALGKGCDVTGELLASSGDTITKFESSHLGMGSFSLQPVSGLSYYALVKDKRGSEIKAKLPASFPEGMAINVTVASDKELIVSVRTNENTLPLYLNRDLILRFSSRNLATWSTNVRISSLVNYFFIPDNNFPSGIIRVTLSESGGLPLCERLVYLQKNNDIWLKINTDKAEYRSREKTTTVVTLLVDTSITGGASLSLSASEAGLSDISSHYPTTISSWFLLESDVRGPVEEPSYYFDPDNPERLKDLDLLLMTQGWRDFQWKYDTLHEFSHETGFTITGKIKRIVGDNPVQGAKINMVLYGNSLTHVMDTETDSLGFFKLEGIDLIGKGTLVISATDKRARSFGRLFLDSLTYEPEQVRITFSNGPERILLPENYAGLKQEAVIKSAFNKNYTLNDTINIGEVIITARRPETPQERKVKETRQVYRSPDKELVVPIEMDNFTGDVFQMISGRIPGIVLIRGRNELDPNYPNDVKVIVRNQGGINGTGALILLDGRRLDGPEDISNVLSIPAFMIDRIDVLNASPAYGMSGANGIINIITRTGIRRDSNETLFNTSTITISGYGTPKIFYSPEYDTPKKPSDPPDNRSTIFWEPNLTIEKNNSVTLEYYNTDNPATINITVEGITEEGIPVSGKATYEIK